MATTYHKNNNQFDVAVSTASGVAINVAPGKVVKDLTGVFYADYDLLTSVLENTVGASDVVYIYDPVHYATIDNTTGKVTASEDNAIGVSGYSGTSGYSGAVGTSGYSGATFAASGYGTVTVAISGSGASKTLWVGTV